MGRTIAIGDIHGCADALEALLNVIDLSSDDTIVTLGDYIDRGPASRDVLEILLELMSDCRLIPLLGNHELMLAKAFTSRTEYEHWCQFGGIATLRSYGNDIRNIPAHHLTFINHCQRYFATDTHFFVHASYDPFVDLPKQPDEILFWQHVEDRVPQPHISGRIAILGHTPQESGEIRDLGHIKIIDTFCYGDRWLTAYDVHTGEQWQARMDGLIRGQSRTGTTSVPGADIDGDRDNGHDDTDERVDDSRPTNKSEVSNLDNLPIELNGRQFKQLASAVVDRLAQFLDELGEAQVWPGPFDPETHQLEPPTFPETATHPSQLLDRVFDEFVPPSFNTTSPGYLAYIPGGGLPDAALADLIASITNRYVTVWNAAPHFAHIERTVIGWFCDMVDYPKSSGGFLSSGGSIANQTAIVTARAIKLQDDFSSAVVYASNQSHHCLAKSAFLAGIPRKNFRVIDCDEHFRIDLARLKQQIEKDIVGGFTPFLLIGNAGTTNTGAIDDLTQLRKLADEFRMWFHVDAAYGGFFCLTVRGKALLRGIETADSIVLDPHKGLFLSYGTGCLLVKNANHLWETHSFTSDYMPSMVKDNERVDFCEISPELSRPNRSLRLWWPINRLGIGVFRDLLNQKLDLTQFALQRFRQLQESWGGKLLIVSEPELSIIVLRLHNGKFSQASNDAMNQRWIEEINRSGRVMVSGSRVNGHFVVRVCILSFRTHIDRMEECLEIMETTGEHVLRSQVS
ncbi:MAG TPA: aminotransferase class I/II-fold pyridoxal phosphate-dependent enzyme [Pirellulaceae bacterium]|nr:aminotransferase class I/II-fold pyridoxal phosphate-dependent enzyme [Pirellulaceae bacterium]HMO93201.1 aminotransferase class I/II-fold pyridoxal phosphate-dependent enzyme [Pirellulaceae bacterium]HMP70032.1 aminotransferase class I/II-fold pyridoxal phosphate-dependent enzyme [Pirellulaceae bacterium]